MTPSEELRAAAAKVRELAAAATPGPWRQHDPWDQRRNCWSDAAWMAFMSPVAAAAVARNWRGKTFVGGACCGDEACSDACDCDDHDCGAA